MAPWRSPLSSGGWGSPDLKVAPFSKAHRHRRPPWTSSLSLKLLPAGRTAPQWNFLRMGAPPAPQTLGHLADPTQVPDPQTPGQLEDHAQVPEPRTPGQLADPTQVPDPQTPGQLEDLAQVPGPWTQGHLEDHALVPGPQTLGGGWHWSQLLASGHLVTGPRLQAPSALGRPHSWVSLGQARGAPVLLPAGPACPVTWAALPPPQLGLGVLVWNRAEGCMVRPGLSRPIGRRLDTWGSSIPLLAPLSLHPGCWVPPRRCPRPGGIRCRVLPGSLGPLPQRLSGDLLNPG